METLNVGTALIFAEYNYFFQELRLQSIDMKQNPTTKIINSQEKAYRFLKDAILAIKFKPNQRLRALDIAKQIKISRTPVREAMSRLEQEGLIASNEGWGYVVRSISLKEAMDIYQVREVLEVAAIIEAMPSIDHACIVKLREYLKDAEKMLAQKKVIAWRDNTRAFISLIVSIGGNVYLAKMLSLIDDRIRWLGAMTTDRHFERLQESTQELKKILRAIVKRDEVAAVAAVRNHVANARESFLKFAVKNQHPFSF